MMESEWLSCEDWRPMLAFLSGRLSQRKATLYVCAGLRSIWDLLYDGCSQYAVEVTERAADGEASAEDLAHAEHYGETPTFGYDFDAEFVRGWNCDSPGVMRLMEMGVYTADDLHREGLLGEEKVRECLLNAAHIAYHAHYQIEGGQLNDHLLEHLSKQEEWPKGNLVREIFGNPFRPVILDPIWQSRNDAVVVRLAQAAYDERILPAGTLDNSRLAILADALEEAGCGDEQILTHLRSGGEHYRGCFAIDALLGRP